MSHLEYFMVSVLILFTSLMALRMYGDWIVLSASAELKDRAALATLSAALRVWVGRHLLLAGLSSILCFSIRLLPTVPPLQGIDSLLVAYTVLSLLFAGIDHALGREAVQQLKHDGYRR